MNLIMRRARTVLADVGWSIPIPASFGLFRVSQEFPDRVGGAIFEKVQDIQKIEGIQPRTFADSSSMMTVASRTFSVWATAELGPISRTRHWVLRRENGRIVMFLAEDVDQDFRPRFRKTRPDEEEGAGRPGHPLGAGGAPAGNQPVNEDFLEFFPLLVLNTRQGFYGDPVYGGNDDRVGWRVIGFPGPSSLKATVDGSYTTLEYMIPEAEWPYEQHPAVLRYGDR